MSRRPWMVAVLATLLVGGTAAPAGAVPSGAGATRALSALVTTVQASPVAATRDPAGRLNVIRTRGDGVILRDQMATPGSRFLGWRASSGPALLAMAAESDTFVAVEAGLDASGNIYVSRQNNAGSDQWTAWQQLLDLQLTSIALARNADGRLEMIGTLFSGSVIRRTQVAAGSVDAAAGWGPWRVLDGELMQSVAAEINSDGRITIVGIGRSGASTGLPFVRTQTAVNSTSWWQWTPLPGGPLPGGAHLNSIAIAKSNDDKLKVFGIDDAGRLLLIREATFDATSWDPSWFVAQDGHGGAIAAQSDANGTIHLFGNDGAGTLSYRTGSIDDVYGSWRPLNQYLPAIDFSVPKLKALVIRVEWPGRFQGPNGRGLSELTQMVNSDQYWPEVSYGGRPDFTVSTVGQMVAIPAPSASLTPCSAEYYRAISSVVDPIAANRSRDPNLFDKVLYYLPNLPECTALGVVGRGEVGGKRAWVNANPTDKASDTQGILHELGHTLGLDHATARSCFDGAHQPVTLSTDCTDASHGDPHSVMGNRQSGGIAASQRAYLGWMNGRMANVPASGFTYTISPVELTMIEPGRSTLQALRIDDNGIILWVELRQQVGADTNVVTNPGVYIYQEDTATPRFSHLLDMTPGSHPENRDIGFDHDDANLAVGRTWVNPLGHLKITVTSANSAGAGIVIAPA